MEYTVNLSRHHCYIQDVGHRQVTLVVQINLLYVTAVMMADNALGGSAEQFMIGSNF